MDIHSDSRFSISPRSETSIDRHPDGFCLTGLEARVDEGCQNLHSKIQGNLEKLWDMYLDAVALDGPFPQGQHRTKWDHWESTDMIPLDRINVAESGEALPPMTVNPEPVIWIYEERPDLVRLENEGNISLRQRIFSAVLAMFTRVLNQISRSCKFVGTNLLLGLIPVAGPLISSVLFYLRVYRRIESLEIGKSSQTFLANKALKHMVKQLLISLLIPIVGAIYNRIVQWNRVSYEQTEGLVLEQQNANLDFINFRNEIFNWTAQQRAQGVATQESSPLQRFTIVEVIDDPDLQRDDAAAPLALPERALMPFDSGAGMVSPFRGVQAWVDSQAHFVRPYELPEIPFRAAPPAATSVDPHDFDPTVQGHRTSEVIDQPKSSSAAVCCRRPVFIDAPIMDQFYIPAAGSSSSSGSNLPSDHGGGPPVQVDGEGNRPTFETEASSSPDDRAHSNVDPGDDVAGPGMGEHDSHESSDEEPIELRRDKGKGRAVDPSSSTVPFEVFFGSADLSAAGPSSLGARMATNNSSLRPMAPAAVAECDDPRAYCYPVCPLLTPAMAEMESQQNYIPTSAFIGPAASPLERLISALNRLSQPIPSAFPIPAPMPGSPSLSSSWSSRPKTRQEEAELAGGRRYAINEILDRRGFGGTDPSSPVGFVRVDSFPPVGIVAAASPQSMPQDELQGQLQDQDALTDAVNGILSYHSECGLHAAASHIYHPALSLSRPTPLEFSVICGPSNDPRLQESPPDGLPYPPPGRMYVYVRLTNSYANIPAPKRMDVARAQAAQIQSCRFLQDEAQSLRKGRTVQLDYRGFDFDEEDREIAQEEYRRYLASLPQPPRFYIDDTPEVTVASSNHTLDDASSQWDFNSDDQAIADRNERRFQSLARPPQSNVLRQTTRSIGKLWKSTLHALNIKKKKPAGGDGSQQAAETGEPLSATTTLVISEISGVSAGSVAMGGTLGSPHAEEIQVSSTSQPRPPSSVMPPLVLPGPIVPLEESHASSFSQRRYTPPELPTLVLTAPLVPPEERRLVFRQGRMAPHLLRLLEPLPPYSEIDPLHVWTRSSENIETTEPPTCTQAAQAGRHNLPGTVQRVGRHPAQSPVAAVRALIQDQRASEAILLSAPSAPSRALVQDRRDMEMILATAGATGRSLLPEPLARGPDRFHEAQPRHRAPGDQVSNTAIPSNRSGIVRRPALRIASTSSSSNAATTRVPLIDRIPTRVSLNVMDRTRPDQFGSNRTSRSNVASVQPPLIDLIPTRVSSVAANDTSSSRASHRSAVTTQRPLIDQIPSRASYNTADETRHPSSEQFSSGGASRSSTGMAMTQRLLVDLIPTRGSSNLAREACPAADRYSSGSLTQSNMARTQYHSVGSTGTQSSSNAVEVSRQAPGRLSSINAAPSNTVATERPSLGPARTRLSYRSTNGTRPVASEFNFGSIVPLSEVASAVSTGGNFTQSMTQPDVNVSPEDLQWRNHHLNVYSFATAGRLQYSSSQVSVSSDQLQPEEERDQDNAEDDGDGGRDINEGGSNGDGDGTDGGEDDDEDTKTDIEVDTEDGDEKDDETDDDEDDNGASGNPNQTLPSQFDDSDGANYRRSRDIRAPSSSQNTRPRIQDPAVSSYGLEQHGLPRTLRVMNSDPTPGADASALVQSNAGMIARAWQAGHVRSSGPTSLLCSSFTPKEDDESPYAHRTSRRRRGLTPLADQSVLNSFQFWTAHAKEDELFQRSIEPAYLSFATCPVPPTVYPSREDMVARRLDSQRGVGHSQRSSLSGPPLMAHPCARIAFICASGRAGVQAEQGSHHTMPANPVLQPTTTFLSTVTGGNSRNAPIQPVDPATAYSSVVATSADRKKSEKEQWRKTQEELWASFGLMYYHNSDDEDHADAPSNIPESIVPGTQEQARNSALPEARELEVESARTLSVMTPDAHQWMLESLSASSSSAGALSQLQGNCEISAMPLPTGLVRSDGRPWSKNAALALQAASQMYPTLPLGQDGGFNGGELTKDQYRHSANRQRKLQIAQALIFMAKDDKIDPQGGNITTQEQSSSSSVSAAPHPVLFGSVGDLTVAIGSLEVDGPFANATPLPSAQTTPPINSKTLSSSDMCSSEQLPGAHTVSPAEAWVPMPSEPRINTEHLTFELNNVVMAEAEHAYIERAGGESGDGVVRVFTFASAYQEPAGSENGLPVIPLQRVDRPLEPQK